MAVFSKYIHNRQTKSSSDICSDMMKEFQANVNLGILREVEPLIWYIFQAKQKLASPFFHPIGILAETISAIPPLNSEGISKGYLFAKRPE